jgi:hypothetical protein
MRFPAGCQELLLEQVCSAGKVQKNLVPNTCILYVIYLPTTAIIGLAANNIVLAFLITHYEGDWHDEFLLHLWLISELKPFQWRIILKWLKVESTIAMQS